MDVITQYVKIIRQYLQMNARIHSYSNPNFILETVLTFIVLLIYLYLHYEITQINRKAQRLKPNVVLCEKGSFDKESGDTSVTHYSSTTIAYKTLRTNFSTNFNNSQMEWALPIEDCMVNRIVTPKRKPYGGQLINLTSEQLINLTPEQFVKIDKERKLREKEVDSYMNSLSTLCKNILKRKYSSKTLGRQVEMARESLQCNKMSLEGKYLGFKTDAMTRSLFNMLEQMITNSSLQNPLPFKGDITTLALDVAELSTDTHYVSKNLGKWDANNSSSCISDETDDTESVGYKAIKNRN